MATGAGQTAVLAYTDGKATVSTPSVGGVATHACTQLTAAGSQGPASHSGQCWHGSEAAVRAGADAMAIAGIAAARTARQPSRPAKKRRRDIAA